jgi:hypothetical protein
MTIGIGVVCSYKKPLDCFILACDQLGSFGDSFSTKRFGKMFCMEDERVFAVCSGSVENASEILPLIAQNWKAAPERNLGFIRAGLQEAVSQYKKYRFGFDVLPKYAIGLKEDWRKTANDMGISGKLLKALKRQSLGCQLVVGTFDDAKNPHLFQVEEDGSIYSNMNPGFCAIGSGSPNALFWLSFRGQNSGMKLVRSAYHVVEAKVMAEQSPHVGKEDLNLLICLSDRWYLLTQDKPSVEGCPITLKQMEELLSKYATPNTDSLQGD